MLVKRSCFHFPAQAMLDLVVGAWTESRLTSSAARPRIPDEIYSRA